MYTTSCYAFSASRRSEAAWALRGLGLLPCESWVEGDEGSSLEKGLGKGGIRMRIGVSFRGPLCSIEHLK